MTVLRVLLVDDHTLFREGIQRVLNEQSDMEVVGEAANGHQAIKAALALRPDVVLMDITMPDMNGLEATAQLKRQMPELPILLLTVHDDPEYLFRALDMGASGYVLKEAETDELVMAIQAAARNEIFLSPTMTRWLVQDYLQRGGRGGQTEESSLPQLTDRQRDVLQLLAEGFSNQEIADKLVLSPYTVQTHRNNIMRKLNLHSRTDLIKYAIRHGLTDLDTSATDSLG